MAGSKSATVSLIVPTKDEHAMLRRLVDGLVETASAMDNAIELIVVDNNSQDPRSLEYLDSLSAGTSMAARLPTSVIRYPHEFNYSIINNLAAGVSDSDFLCFLNNDMEIIAPDWLIHLLEQACKPETGCVGAKLYFPDDTIQHAGVVTGVETIAGHLYKHVPREATGLKDYLQSVQQVSAVTGACLLLRREIFESVGGFDEQLAVAFNDVDLCLKVGEAGYRNIWTPHAELYHHESKSRGRSRQRNFWQKRRHKREVRYMQRKWPGAFTQDAHQQEQSEYWQTQARFFPAVSAVGIND